MIPRTARDLPRDGIEVVVLAADLARRAVAFFDTVEPAHSARMERARRAVREGLRHPIKIVVSPQGKLWIDDGRHRYLAALDLGLPLRVRFVRGHRSMDS